MPKALRKYSPENFIEFHKDVRFNNKLTYGQKIFLAEVQAMSKKGRCYYSSRSLGRIFNVSHQTVINWVRELVNLGFLEVGLDCKTNHYKKFLIPTNQE